MKSVAMYVGTLVLAVLLGYGNGGEVEFEFTSTHAMPARIMSVIPAFRSYRNTWGGQWDR